MGMFDEIECDPSVLPIKVDNPADFQTKSLDNLLERYKISADKKLYFLDYKIEDRSEFTKWQTEHPNEEPPENIKKYGWFGMATQVPLGWVFKEDFTGSIVFYDDKHTFTALFVKGIMIHIEHSNPRTAH